MVNGLSAQGKLLDVLHVPSFVYSLVSVSALAKQGLDVKFNADSIDIMRKDASIARGTRVGSLYTLDTCLSRSLNHSSLLANLQVWHERLAHVHRDGILQMARGNVVQSLRIAPQAMLLRAHHGKDT